MGRFVGQIGLLLVVPFVLGAAAMGLQLKAMARRATEPHPAEPVTRATDYFPDPGDWERRQPAAVGMDAALLDSAIAFVMERGPEMGEDLEAALAERFAGDPYGELLGPMRRRGAGNGLVFRHGYLVAEWGDTRRVDMTFSVTKSFLSAVAGLAYDRGLIRDMRERVGESVHDGGFDSPQNTGITWHFLLQQTSEWEGTLWGKPDVADRRRGRDRQLQNPGTFWEYNDVRVNRTALSLLQIWRESLPSVLKRELMDPIDASDTWEWHGYRNSYITIDDERVQSVSGGGHWGGGMWISSRDLARFGYLYLRNGKWGERQILSEEWIAMTITPTDIQPTYGYMWWLNTDGALWPGAPHISYAARGGGLNAVWIDPEHDLLIVARWVDRNHMDGFLTRVLASLDTDSTR